MTALRMIAVTVWRGGRRLLDDVHLTARAGELLVVVGENGAGKSTLLDRLAGVLAPEAGAVLLGERPLAHLSPRERAQRVASCGQTPPAPADQTVAARIAQGLAPRRGLQRLFDAAAERAARSVAEELCVDPLLERPLGTLSGGELRRVQVARALIDDEAEAIVLDEPHAGVDVRHQPRVSAALRRRADAGHIVVASVHDLGLALGLADRVVGLREGRIVVDGPPEEALSSDAVHAVFGVRAEVVEAPSGTRAIVLGRDAGRS